MPKNARNPNPFVEAMVYLILAALVFAALGVALFAGRAR